MRNRTITSAALALGLAFAAGLAAQAPAGHPHTGLEGRTLHHGDRVWFSGQRSIGADEVIEGDVVVANGSLTVSGEIHGDAVVGDGNLVLERGSVVYGDAVVTGGKLVNNGGSVLGKVQEGTPRSRSVGATQTIHMRRGWLGALGEGWAGLVRTLSLGLVLGGLGLALTFYGRSYLEQASDVVRRAPLAAGGIGLAANVLALPAFLAGIAALALTIIGIPLLLVFVPLFWTVLCALAGVGILAVAHALGERTAERSGSYEPIHRNAYSYLVTGLVVLLAPLLVSNVLVMTPFVGWMGGLVGLLAGMMLWLAASVGAGAVLIVAVRAWRERGYRRGWDGMDDLGTGSAHTA